MEWNGKYTVCDTGDSFPMTSSLFEVRVYVRGSVGVTRNVIRSVPNSIISIMKKYTRTFGQQYVGPGDGGIMRISLDSVVEQGFVLFNSWIFLIRVGR